MREADIERVVFAGRSRVLDIGVRQRLFTGATERAVKLVHRRCAGEFCDVPSYRCETDHVVEVADGGLTEQGNGEPRCKFHHRFKTEQRRTERQRERERDRERELVTRARERVAALAGHRQRTGAPP